MPTALNAANEEAVAGFLKNRIGFLDIARLVEHILSRMQSGDTDSLATVLEMDAEARRLVRQEILAEAR
jgi:1-deoxy-D-xylulose-5-phosphate reductoisomerase